MITTINHTANLHLFWNDTLATELQQFFAGRLKCQETAADLTHETYLRLRKSIDDSPPDNARALAFRIAVNLVIDYQRRLNVRNLHITDADSSEYAELISDQSSPDPSTILISRERYATLQTALAELPIDCRTAFMLNRVQDMSYEEIAKSMSISRSKVGRLLEQAVAHCSLRLKQ